VLNGASVVGRVMSNALASKIGPFNVVIPGFYLVSILIFCSLGVGDISGVMIFAVLYGFFSGTCELHLKGLTLEALLTRCRCEWIAFHGRIYGRQ
jgi:hypothetical protein